MSEPEDRVPGRVSRVDALAITAIVLSVVALAFSLPAFFTASHASETAQSAQDRAKNLEAAAPATPPTTPPPTVPVTPSSAQPASCPALAKLGSTVSNHGTVAASGSKLAIRAGDFFFAPTCITAVPSGTVSLVVRSTGKSLHNVSVPGQRIDKDVSPGKTITVRVQVAEVPVKYFCKFREGSGMVGVLVPSA